MATEPGENTAAPQRTTRRNWIPWIVVAVVMAFEGAAVFVFTKMLAPQPPPAAAHEGSSDPSAPNAPEAFGEVELGSSRVTNRLGAKAHTVTVSVSMLARSSRIKELTERIAASKARLSDRVNYVLRSADPKLLNQPGLETIKRQLKAEFDRVLGDDQLVQEVLIPELLVTGD
jgi:flagellar basal body-associated protein FliL